MKSIRSNPLARINQPRRGNGLDGAVDAGATAVVQPGGSVRDDEVVAAANEHGLTMVFTGERHFKH